MNFPEKHLYEDLLRFESEISRLRSEWEECINSNNPSERKEVICREMKMVLEELVSRLGTFKAIFIGKTYFWDYN